MPAEKIAKENLDVLASLFIELWPDCRYEEEYANCKKILESAKETCFLIKRENSYVGFIQLSLRTDYVEGVETYPVAYIEGLYVKPKYRKFGIGKRLVDLGAKWGREMGCQEYASDAELENDTSIQFHKSLGFQEMNRIVCFKKEI